MALLDQKIDFFNKKSQTTSLVPLGNPLNSFSMVPNPKSSDNKPISKRWEHRMSIECLSRSSSTLKASNKNLDPSAVITLGTARPMPEYYPWESITLRGVNAASLNDCGNSDTMSVMTCERGENGYDLNKVLNYGNAIGSPQLLHFITEHVEFLHDPPYDDWESCLTCGTTSALDIVFRMLCNRGEYMLAEAHTYSGALEAAKPQGIQIVGIKMDQNGLRPDHLELILSTWDHQKGSKPSVLYTIPSGQNPTGTTQSTERRREIYRIAQRHDLIVIEDDPYYLLQLGEEASKSVQGPVSATEFVQRLPKSYLSLDTDGRVIRLETASKILAPGLRSGWMTSCSQFMEKFLNHSEFSTVAPSGPSQLMLYKLLDQTWGHHGLLDWLSHLSWSYLQRRNSMLESCKRHLPNDICTWGIPRVGMFIWVQLDWSKHPSIRPCGDLKENIRRALQIEERICTNAKRDGVLVSKGSWFAAEPQACAEIHFRITFAAAPKEQLETAVERFGNALCTEFERAEFRNT